ncbi:HAMP domain-containing histidine kinase [Rhizobium sp. TRM96647]|uniref:sensor histidine kinase n=1 Tax=unclassified Rhizobium TaxID=2613769 RepID=UPI0021E6DABD|nr:MULTISPECIES: HAMP domain-containing sensor histidine kinase [unclassified Rhizobium]MCV3736465.1 HAMP domain-containing histidine kinase [Rhizobium sp. TRM96647]MCV3758834.1 HAMP domain-containing histidine kinase [Rhizobium sp. TRM96650]
MKDNEAAPMLGNVPMPSAMKGLSGRLLLLTVAFIVLAEVLIFAPSIANMRVRWLSDRLNVAAAAAIVADGFPQQDLTRALQDETLMATGTKAIVLRRHDAARLVAVADIPPKVDAQYDLSAVEPISAICAALDTLFFGGDRIIRAYGPLGDSGTTIEVVLTDKALRKAMLSFAWTVFLLTTVLSAITGGLIFLTINRMLVRPIRSMTGNMRDFAADPSDPTRILKPSGGQDELAVAAVHLAEMQRALQGTLKEQKNLADLGLAVSKINHDMRNILSSAQLMSDRLADVDDPVVKRFAPKLLRTIDRAVGYTTDVLSYGRMQEPAPRRRFVPLAPLVADVSEMLSIDPVSGVDFVMEVETGLEVDADSEQLFRVIHNLCRNAVEALTQHPGRGHGYLTVSAVRTGSVVSITVDDTGPGMPPKARENLFAAFRGSARSGGTGLGLAIARELVLAHGGTIALVEKATEGTQFRIELPDRPVPLAAFRNRAS